MKARETLGNKYYYFLWVDHKTETKIVKSKTSVEKRTR